MAPQTEPFNARALVGPFCWLGALALATHYWRASGMGLYEDDLAFGGRAINCTSGELGIWLAKMPGWTQGRPLGYVFAIALPWIGWHLGGLTGIYAIGWLVVTLNTALMHRLIARVADPAAAWMGAVFFLLFPADTTKSYLMHALMLQPALLFLLLACHAWLSGMRVAAYGLIVGALFTYESPVLPFLVITLLAGAGRKEWMRHAGVMAAILAVAFILRRMTGDMRTTGSGLEANMLDGGSVLAAPLKAVASVVIGPCFAAWQMIGQPAKAFAWAPAWLVAASLAGGVFCGVAVVALVVRAGLEGAWEGRRRSMIAGAVGLPLAYALAFTHFPPLASAGRMTSVHLAATFGGALLAGPMLAAALRGKVGRFGALGFIVLWTATAWIVQENYVEAWQAEKSFWRQVITRCPDLDDADFILAQIDEPSPLPYILTHSWADHHVLANLYRFPKGRRAPKLFSVLPGWETAITSKNGRLRWRMPKGIYLDQLPLETGKVILVRWDGRHLSRIGGSIVSPAGKVKLKNERGGERIDAEPTNLHRTMIGDAR